MAKLSPPPPAKMIRDWDPEQILERPCLADEGLAGNVIGQGHA